ncbi:MAG: helix-turn-helix domain-containing protein [Acidobacteria bacterium]|nr:helix-turn-helix domain-containing protein [Acidobacteriota bacterium]MCA1608166.1 helix-turn-helix domain-containing protein [Acidobacteriota bacterium]
MEKLSTKQAGEILGVSRRRVISLIEQGRLKAERFSNVYMIDRKELETVQIRKNGRPTKAVGRIIERPFKTIFDIAPDLVGCLSSDLGDLSTNKKYLKGLGRDKTINR